MTATMTDAYTNAWKTAMESFQDTLKAGVKFHEETARFWTDNANRNLETFQTKTQQFVNDTTPFGKKNVEQFNKTFEQNVQRTMDLYRDAWKQGMPANPAEMSEHMASMWKNTFETMRESVDALAKANTDMLNRWVDVAGTNGNGATKPAGKPGK